MRWTTIAAGLAAISLAGLAANLALSTGKTTRVAVRQPATEHDAIAQSFERELNHEPVPSGPIRRESIDDDELYRSVNTIHWTPAGPVNSASTDPDTRRSNDDENAKH